MVEWGNYWAKAIRMRDYKQTEAYAGMFSQIGELYNVKVWYKSHPTSQSLTPSCGPSLTPFKGLGHEIEFNDKNGHF
jgi:hypothetical protein